MDGWDVNCELALFPVGEYSPYHIYTYKNLIRIFNWVKKEKEKKEGLCPWASQSLTWARAKWSFWTH